jgi:Na+/melibiose symporter-like transporter
MDAETKNKLIAISIGFLIFMISYFVIRSKYIKSKPTGYKKTIIIHKEGKVKEKITFEETYSNYQLGFFILFLIFLFTVTAIYLTCFKCKNDYSMPDLSSSSIESSIKPLD